jgi:tetratricopeptide (TPR) repeat protein
VCLGIHRYVFVKEGPLLPHTRAFLTGIQSDITYQVFGNVGELESMVKVSLKTDMALALRSLRNHRIIASPGSVGQVTSYLVGGVVARQEDSTTLIDRLRELLLDFAEQVTTDPQDLEYAREAALYVLEFIQPAVEALEDGRYLDCVKYLDGCSLDVARQVFGFLINSFTDRVAKAARGHAHSDLVRGWAHRARGRVDLAQQDFGKARRRFRWALRYSRIAQDSTLIGAALLSIGISYQEQNDERQARQSFEEALPYARGSDEPWSWLTSRPTLHFSWDLLRPNRRRSCTRKVCRPVEVYLMRCLASPY